MIFRLLFWLIVFYVAFKVIRLVLLPAAKQPGTKAGKPAESPHQPTPLVACPVCGTFFQERQGLAAAGRKFCSAECARKG